LFSSFGRALPRAPPHARTHLGRNQHRALVGGVVVGIVVLHLHEALLVLEWVQVSERRRQEAVAAVVVVDGHTAAVFCAHVGWRRAREEGSVVVVSGFAIRAAARHNGVVALAKEGKVRTHGFG
jgi:hypothetical protein